MTSETDVADGEVGEMAHPYPWYEGRTSRIKEQYKENQSTSSMRLGRLHKEGTCGHHVRGMKRGEYHG